MKVSNNEITIQRGESFSFDKIIQNRDGSPYIVSKELRNPHILISVSSTKFEQNNRYLNNFYLPIPISGRFSHTTPIPLTEILTSENGESLYSDWPNLTVQNNVVMTGYYKGNLVNIEENDAVFSLKKEDGTVEYKYPSIADGEVKWIDYNFRFVKQFDSSITAKWNAQTYYYSINLVFGESTEHYIRQLCDERNLKFENLNNAYESLRELGTEFYHNFDLTSPIAKVDGFVPILIPTKISVLSNLNGGNYE